MQIVQFLLMLVQLVYWIFKTKSERDEAKKKEMEVTLAQAKDAVKNRSASELSAAIVRMRKQ